jgi:hypothetical protein
MTRNLVYVVLRDGKKLNLSNSSRGDRDKPLVQTREANNLGLDVVHGLLGQFDPGVLDGRNPFDQRVETFPGGNAPLNYASRGRCCLQRRDVVPLSSRRYENDDV